MEILVSTFSSVELKHNCCFLDVRNTLDYCYDLTFCRHTSRSTVSKRMLHFICNSRERSPVCQSCGVYVVTDVTVTAVVSFVVSDDLLIGGTITIPNHCRLHLSINTLNKTRVFY